MTAVFGSPCPVFQLFLEAEKKDICLIYRVSDLVDCIVIYFYGRKDFGHAGTKVREKMVFAVTDVALNKN